MADVIASQLPAKTTPAGTDEVILTSQQKMNLNTITANTYAGTGTTAQRPSAASAKGKFYINTSTSPSVVQFSDGSTWKDAGGGGGVAGGLTDVSADYVASTDAIGGVLTIPVDGSKNRANVLLDANVALALAVDPGVEMQFTVRVQASGADRTLAFQGLGYVNGAPVDELTVADGRQRFLGFELSDDNIGSKPYLSDVSAEFGGAVVPAPTTWDVSAGVNKVTVTYVNAAGATHTLYQYSQDNGATWSGWQEVPSGSPFEITGLTAGVATRVQGAHTNDSGSFSSIVEDSATPTAAASTPKMAYITNTTDKATLGSYYQALITFIENLGYEVTLVEAATVTTSTDWSAYDVLWWDHLGSAALGNIPDTLAKPMVISIRNGALYQKMVPTSSDYSQGGSQYIVATAAGVTSGVLGAVSSGQTIQINTNGNTLNRYQNWSSGTQSLADWDTAGSGYSSLLYLPAGGLKTDGVAAPADRIALPIGFNPTNSWTTAMQNIVRDSILKVRGQL